MSGTAVPPSLLEPRQLMLGKAAQARLRIMPRPSLDRIDRQVRVTKQKGQKRQDSFATLATRMDRVFTGVNLYRMSPFPGSEQVATNVSANILLLE